jgi:hypothetical protein
VALVAVITAGVAPPIITPAGDEQLAVEFVVEIQKVGVAFAPG